MVINNQNKQQITAQLWILKNNNRAENGPGGPRAGSGRAGPENANFPDGPGRAGPGPGRALEI
jgi:hypothetical protein